MEINGIAIVPRKFPKKLPRSTVKRNIIHLQKISFHRLFPGYIFFDHPCRNAGRKTAARNVTRHDGACGDHGAAPYRDAFKYHSPGPYPDVVSDANRRRAWLFVPRRTYHDMFIGIPDYHFRKSLLFVMQNYYMDNIF